MVTPVQLFITFVLLVLSLADDVKLKHKPASKPVRLFTEEDLKRHDGSEVTTCLLYRSVGRLALVHGGRSRPFTSCSGGTRTNAVDQSYGCN